MNNYKTLQRYYKRELEDFIEWVERNRAAGRTMAVGSNVASRRSFDRKFTAYVCSHYDIKLVPTDWLPDLLEKTGLPKNWKELVSLSLIDLAKDDFKISKVR